VIPIDFLDVVWGLDVQDLAITVKALENSSPPDVALQAFKLGYQSVRPWPELDVEMWKGLTAARLLQVVNL
jgi:Ser/Thr protein kinase RdoA (MazF antagonist)